MVLVKSWLIVKNSELAESARKVFCDEENIALDGRRHPGVVIGSKELKNQCCQENGFLVSKETVVLRRWGRSKQKFGFIKRVDKG